MTARLVLGAAALLGLLTCSAAASDGGMRWPVTYLDPAGDANGGPDSVSVLEGGDPGPGLIGFKVGVTALSASSAVEVDLDADQSSTTGDNGWDFALWSLGPEWGLAAWDGAAGSWKDATPAGGSASQSGDSVVFSLPLSAIGGVTSLRYLVETYAQQPAGSDPEYVVADRYPDRGVQTFDVGAVTSAPPPAPLIRAVLAKPARPKAGKPFQVEYRILDRETFEARTDGTVTVTMSVGGRRLRVSSSVSGGLLTARAPVPAAAKGKLLGVTVTHSESGRTTQRHDEYRVG